jgi:hypothetical protein
MSSLIRLVFRQPRCGTLALCAIGLLACVSVAGGAPYYTSDYAGATVFRDRDLNGLADTGEPSTQTGGDGRFPLRPVRGKGRLSLTGGTDVATGRVNTLLLTAPNSARAVSTLTALWQALLKRGKPASKIRKLLFLPRNAAISHHAAVPLANTKPKSRAETLVKRNAQHKTLVQFLSSLVRSRQANSGRQALRSAAQAEEDASIGAIAEALGGIDTGQPVDITDPERVGQILGASLADLGVSIRTEDLQLVSVVAATSINAELEKTSASEPASFDTLEQEVGKGSDYLASADFQGFKAYFFPAPKFTGMSEDTGSSQTDRVTGDASPTFTGIAPPQAVRLRVYRNGELAAEIVPDAGGNWTYTSQDLKDGLYTFELTGVTAFGYEGMISATMPVTVDATPPARPTVTPLNTTLATPTLHGQWSVGSGDSVTVSVNGKTYGTGNGLMLDADGWQLAIPAADALPKTGTYEVSVTETDAAGNQSTDATANELKLVITIPAPLIVALSEDTGASAGDGITTDTSPTLSGTVEGSSVSVKVYRDGGLVGQVTPNFGNWSFTDEVPDGKYRYTVAGINAAGEQGILSAIKEVTVDTASPSTPTVTALQTGSLRPTLTGTWSQTAGDSLSISVNGHSYTSADGLVTTSSTWSLHLPTGAGLNQGKSEVIARVSDRAGNPDTEDPTRNELTVSLFAPATPVTAATRNYAVVQGDFNGDGKLDLATRSDTTKYAPVVSVLLGGGSGTFQAHAEYPAGIGISGIAVGDIHGGGRPDLITVYRGNPDPAAPLPASVSILAGRLDGSFVKSGSDYPVPDGASAVAVGDLNGDGKADIITANAGDPYAATPIPGSVSVLVNNGAEQFQPHADYPTGDQPQAIALGDLDGDGKLDLVTANYSGQSISVLAGNGDGSFAAHIDYPLGFYATSVAIADLNDDGKPDVAATTGDARISVLLGKGDGTLGAEREFAAGLAPASLVLGDFDGDGRLDLATANATGNSVSVLLGNGDGSFKPRLDYATGGQSASVVAGDLDNDGKPDLAAANDNTDKISVLLNQAEFGFAARAEYANDDPRTVALGELDGDGKLDAAVVNDKGITVRLGAGDGTWKSSVIYATHTSPRSVSIADFNGDGNADMAATRNYHVSLLVGIGAGVFAPYVDYPNDVTVASLAADFNGDDRPDLVTANMEDASVDPPVPVHIGVMLANADGTLQPSVNYPAGPYPPSVAAGDFNGDGKLDLVAAIDGLITTSPAIPAGVSVFLGRGDGSFDDKVDYLTGDNDAPEAIAAGDFNADGKVDLAVTNSSLSSVGILSGNGDGSFSGPVNFLVGRRPASVALADFNADGKLDIATANTRDNTFSILFGNGRGGFQPKRDFATDIGPTAVRAGDLDGDGRPDLVITNRAALTLSVQLNNQP